MLRVPNGQCGVMFLSPDLYAYRNTRCLLHRHSAHFVAWYACMMLHQQPQLSVGLHGCLLILLPVLSMSLTSFCWRLLPAPLCMRTVSWDNASIMCIHHDERSLDLQNATWPTTLAQICDTIRISSNSSDPTSSSKVCQGFTYDSVQEIAFFMGQASDTTIDLGVLCDHPSRTAWVLNAGQAAHPVHCAQCIVQGMLPRQHICGQHISHIH